MSELQVYFSIIILLFILWQMYKSIPTGQYIDTLCESNVFDPQFCHTLL